MSELAAPTVLGRAPSTVTGIDRADLKLRVESGIGVAKLQLLGRDPELRFADILGFAPPAARRQVDGDALTVAWLAPGDWLIVGDAAGFAPRLAGIADRGGSEALVVDLTHARVAFVVEGDGVRDAIAAHCPLDLWPDAFPVNAVARSPLAAAGMFIARLADTSDGPCFRLVVDQTMASYAVRMLGGLSSSSGATR